MTKNASEPNFSSFGQNLFFSHRPNFGVNQVPLKWNFCIPILLIFKLSSWFGLIKMCRKFQVDWLSLKRVIVLPDRQTERVHKSWIGLKTGLIFQKTYSAALRNFSYLYFIIYLISFWGGLRPPHPPFCLRKPSCYLSRLETLSDHNYFYFQPNFIFFSESIYKDPKCKCTKFQVIPRNKFIFRRPNIGVNQCVSMTSIFFRFCPSSNLAFILV
jgi:hypothetical protein